jgi:hypothetical protein
VCSGAVFNCIGYIARGEKDIKRLGLYFFFHPPVVCCAAAGLKVSLYKMMSTKR